jgi:hypothetical protein
MVASDSTFARVLKWLHPPEAQRFLLSFLPKLESHDLLRTCLSPQASRDGWESWMVPTCVGTGW